MATSSLLTLIDDIATVLDDVAILSKVAAKKTVGVLGDDLALNAEQVSGVKADRELPVVWAVTKGSFLNKLILVPLALTISALAPPLITVLMVIGGLYLCYEGAEKIVHKVMQNKYEVAALHQQTLKALSTSDLDMVAFEKNKIRGAIRTDFILSAEIVVIVLGSVKDAPMETQILVVSALALLITVGVYGLVAAIVKLDDLGLYLLRKSVSGSFNSLQKHLGRFLLIMAPKLMKLLGVIGTIAMFLVGGGILVHSVPWLHQPQQTLQHWFDSLHSVVSPSVFSLLVDAGTGLISGLVVLLIVTAISFFRRE